MDTEARSAAQRPPDRSTAGVAAVVGFALLLVLFLAADRYGALAEQASALAGVGPQPTATAATGDAGGGPAGGGGAGDLRVLVPDVAGQGQAAAEAALRLVGLVPRTALTESDVAATTVVSQKPRAGRDVARGTVVRLSVSSGPSSGGIAADLLLRDDGLTLSAEPAEVLVPPGGAVRIRLESTVACQIDNRADLSVVEGELLLQHGDGATLRRGQGSRAEDLLCGNLVEVGGKDLPARLAVSLAEGAPADDALEIEPIPAIWTFDGASVKVEPSTVVLREQDRLSVRFDVLGACQLVESTGRPINVIEGDGTVPVNGQVTVSVDEPNQDYVLTCRGLERAAPFHIRTGP